MAMKRHLPVNYKADKTTEAKFVNTKISEPLQELGVMGTVICYALGAVLLTASFFILGKKWSGKTK